MKKISILVLISTLLVACNNQNESNKTVQDRTEAKTKTEESNTEFKSIDTEEDIIATALMAAPKESRENAKVIGHNSDGEFATLKEGNNEFICLADDPNQDGFSVACYHKDLEPFMARGRELKAEGKNGKEIFEIREKEIKSGDLEMGKAGSTLHIYYGPKATYDPNTGNVEGAKYRYVVYMPFATSESTGLPTTPTASNHPWIMDPGTHKAHIMISPIK
ncbi:MAG: hypothetical protein WEA99_13320 [Brumimicrobium sp.]